MDLKPLVSVICVTYNHAPYIKTCLDGILMQQTTFPFEIILGEDESTDGTREICIEYTNKYPDKIKLFLRSRNDVIYINGNPTGRYNFIESLKASKGKYIALCDGDDYWTDPLKLQKQVDFLEENENCSFCFHKAYRELVNQQQKNETFPIGLKKNILNASEYLNLVTTATCSLMFRKINIKALNFLNHCQGDFLIYCELLHHGNAGFLDEIMGVYRKHKNGISYNNSSENYLYNRIIELKKEQSYFENHIVKKEIGRIYKIHIQRYLELYGLTTTFKKMIYLRKELIFNCSYRIDFFHKNNKRLKNKLHFFFTKIYEKK